MEVTVKNFKEMVEHGVDVLRGFDIQLGAMDENWNPVNHLLSTEENERCWRYLAKQYVLNTLKLAAINKKAIYFSDEFYDTWLSFLQAVENVVRYGQKNKGIENIINHSGISRETLIMFLD